jgi:DNA-binding response OmpR family regulator/DNA-binding MarR family transcriptional regulator
MSDEILLLDDDPVTLNFLESVLMGAGFVCRTVSDPEQALAAVRAHREIAIVVSDIYMPGLTGLQFVDQLNALALDWQAPAVLLLTAHPTLESAIDALRLGACDFLTKPVRPGELVDVVTRVMERVRRQRAESPGKTPEVEILIRQAEEIAGALRRFTAAPAQNPEPRRPPLADAPASPEETGSRRTTIEAQWPKGRIPVLEAIEGLRKLRRHYDEHKLDDVAWDLLLEMLRAEQKQMRLSVSALTISIPGVSSTTSLRRVSELTARGYIERVPDARDGRRDFVRLTAKARALLLDYLEHADSCLVDVQTAEQSRAPSTGRRR